MEEQQNKLTVRDNVFQSNEITQSHLPFSKLEADIFTVILASLKTDKSVYKYNLKDLLNYLKVEPKHYKNFVESLNNLYEKSIIIKHNKSTEKIRLLSRIKYLNDTNNISVNDDIEINISQEIKPYLFNLKSHFTVYETNSFLQLNSINSKKLYTLFAQFKATEKIRMSKQQIQSILNTNYKDFSVLFAKVIKPAVKEIETKTNVKNITITPIKRGRIIDGYSFNFNYKIVQLKMDLLPPTLDVEALTVFDQLIKEYRLTRAQATIIVEHIPPQEIKKTFHDITLQKVNNKIDNIGGYTLAIFRNKFKLNF
jgi:plasmid replication initiation protein